jgi:hypothetical protein
VSDSFTLGDNTTENTDAAKARGTFDNTVGAFTFLAAAAGNIDTDATLDEWTMNQDRVLSNVADDVTLP